MAQANVQLTGFKELSRKLETLGRKRGKVVVRKAVNKAATPMVKAARRLAPVGETGNLKRGLTKAVRSYKAGALIVAFIGNKRGQGGAAHAHLVEFGTVERYHKSGKSVGAMPAKPFMRPAFDQTKDQQLSILAREIGAGLEKEAARA